MLALHACVSIFDIISIPFWVHRITLFIFLTYLKNPITSHLSKDFFIALSQYTEWLPYYGTITYENILSPSSVSPYKNKILPSLIAQNNYHLRILIHNGRKSIACCYSWCKFLGCQLWSRHNCDFLSKSCLSVKFCFLRW